MTTFERMQKLVKDMPKMSTRDYVDESCSLMADLMEEKDKVLADLELYKGLLKAEQEETQQLRFQKNANWELAVKMEGLATRLATDALTSLAGVVCTPVEGYKEAPHCLSGDIRALRKLAESRREALEWCRDNYPAVRESDDVHFDGKTIEELAESV